MSGRAVVDTTWRDGQALLAARGATAARRLQAVSKGTVTVRGIERYRLDYRWWELE
jgi:hypothetical protein